METAEIQKNNQEPSGFLAVLKQPAFLTLWVSELVSLIGDRILLIVLINLVYERTASASAVSVLSLLKALPALILGGLVGVFIDRWSRKWTMVLSNLILAVLVILLPLVDSLVFIYILYFAMAVVSQFFIPARSAAIPALVPAGALIAANSLFAAAFVAAIAIGPAIGGWITTRFGENTAFLIDALTFLVPAAAVAFLTIPQTRLTTENRQFGRDWQEGFRYLRSQAEMRIALLLMGEAGLLISAISVLGIIVVREKMGGSAADFGWMMSTAGLGMLTAALVSNRLGRSFNRQKLSAWGAILAGAAMVCLSLSTQLTLALACAFPLGLGIITVQVISQTTLQGAPDILRGRMMGFAQTVMGSVTFLSAGLAGLLAGWLGVTPVLCGAGLLAIAFSLFILIFSLPKHRTQMKILKEPWRVIWISSKTSTNLAGQTCPWQEGKAPTWVP
ncbi:MAG: MFS transporter [Anaerolineaceae bacterium]